MPTTSSTPIAPGPFGAAALLLVLIGLDPNVVRATPSVSPAAPGVRAVAEGGSAAIAEKTVADSDLTATSAPPWNPPQAIARRRGWEQALLLPGRIVSLPLVGAGKIAGDLLLELEESNLAARRTGPVDRPSGIRYAVGAAQLGDRTGLGGQVRLSRSLFDRRWSTEAMAELSGSTRDYARIRLGLFGDPAGIEFDHERRPQERFHGIGLGAREQDRTEFSSNRTQVLGRLEWRWDRDSIGTPPRAAIRTWAGPRSVVTHDISDRGSDEGTTSWNERFPELAAATLDRHVDHLVYGAGLSFDRRQGVQRWTHGWRASATVERFDDPAEALALRSGSPRGSRFTRAGGELEGGFSFMRDPRTVRLFARVIDQEVGARAERHLLSDLATLGGHEGLGGFGPGRFRDVDLAHARVNYLIPLVRRFELDVHAEWGGVYPDVWEHFRLETLERSWGFAVRTRLKESSFGSLGMDFSREGARVRFSLEPLE